MPRSRGSSSRRSQNSGFFGQTKTKPQPTQTASRPAPAAPVPAPMNHAPAASMPPQAAPQQGSGLLGSLASTVMQGMAFGTGSAIAHRAVDGVAGPRTVQVEHVNNNAAAADGESKMAPAATGASACEQYNQQFTSCLQSNHGNVSACQFYFDMLSQCQAKGSSMQ